jgi:hypothetical protein
LVPALLPAPPAPAAETPRRKLSIGEVLEPNSVLSGVMLPNYDEQLRLTSLLRAKTVTLVTANEFDGDDVEVRLYQPDRSSRGRLTLTRARYDQVVGKVRATGPTRLTLDRMLTTATGLTLDIGPSEGLFHGPVNTRLSQPPPATPTATAMTVRFPPLTAALLIGTAVAAEPPASAANPAPPAAAGLRAALESSAEATAAAAAYLEKEGRLDSGGDIPVFEPKAVEFVPRDDDTVIDCDGDAYFDGNRRVLVYLGNVRARDPRFTMKGANKLEVFFAEKPAADDKPEKTATTDPSRQPAVAAPAQDPIKKALPGGLGAEVGDLERIVATGAVLFKQQLSAEQIKAGEKPIEASGAILTFQAKTEKITLSGGFPWVRQGNMIQRAMKAEQTITIVNNEASFSPGGTQSIIPTGELQRAQDRKREAGGGNRKDRPQR